MPNNSMQSRAWVPGFVKLACSPLFPFTTAFINATSRFTCPHPCCLPVSPFRRTTHVLVPVNNHGLHPTRRWAGGRVGGIAVVALCEAGITLLEDAANTHANSFKAHSLHAFLVPFLCCAFCSMQYLMALAHGCWAVSHEWVGACLEAGKWVPERHFEAKVRAGQGGRMWRATGVGRGFCAVWSCLVAAHAGE